jgi:hypothetical protein
VVWWIPILVLVHNLEEAIAATRLWPVLSARLRDGAGVELGDPQGFYAALAIVTALPFAVVAWSTRRADRPGRVWAALLVQAVMLLNVFPHAFAAAALRSYSPGLATALVLNLPFSILLYRRATREQWVSRRALAWLAPAALLVHGPGLFVLLWVTGVWLRP